jgi:hypothetical protein
MDKAATTIVVVGVFLFPDGPAVGALKELG